MNAPAQIPAWKKWLSYLYDIRIESTGSEVNEELHVLMSRGKLQLCTTNAIYSYEDRYDNFRLLFDKVEAEKWNASNLLLLGLGMGSVPVLVEKAGMKVDHMTFVEIDEMVVHLAQKYLLPVLLTPYTVICTDAEKFVAQDQNKYDLIISDVFVDDVIPEQLKSTEYLKDLKQLLSANGKVVYNCLASTMEDRKNSSIFFENSFSKIFPSSELHFVWQNYMLIGQK